MNSKKILSGDVSQWRDSRRDGNTSSGVIQETRLMRVSNCGLNSRDEG